MRHVPRLSAALLPLCVAVLASAHGCASRQEMPAGDGLGHVSDGPALVGPLTRATRAGPDFSDCGCTLSTSDGMIVFRDTGSAWMNIEGRDVVVHEDNGFGLGESRKGATHRDTFDVGEVHVEIDWVVTSVCSGAPDEESCEFTGADATITAKKANHREVLVAKGGCGC